MTTDTELRELARDLATGPLADEHCHASVTDEFGELDACGREAEGWVIYDPETGDDRAWPVCSLHMSEVYYGQRADRWVAAVNALPGLLDRADSAEIMLAALRRARDSYRAAWDEALRKAHRAERRADAAEAKLAAIAALVDDWDAIRAHNGRPMLTTANVVDRLRGLLDQDGDA